MQSKNGKLSQETKNTNGHCNMVIYEGEVKKVFLFFRGSFVHSFLDNPYNSAACIKVYGDDRCFLQNLEITLLHLNHKATKNYSTWWKKFCLSLY